MKNKKTRFFKLGLVFFPIGLVLNIVFIKFDVHGIIRELSRLSVLAGFFLMIFGGIYSLLSQTQTGPGPKSPKRDR